MDLREPSSNSCIYKTAPGSGNMMERGGNVVRARITRNLLDTVSPRNSCINKIRTMVISMYLPRWKKENVELPTPKQRALGDHLLLRGESASPRD